MGACPGRAVSFACTLGAEKSRRASVRAFWQAVAGLAAIKTYAMGIPQMQAEGSDCGQPGQLDKGLLFEGVAELFSQNELLSTPSEYHF